VYTEISLLSLSLSLLTKIQKFSPRKFTMPPRRRASLVSPHPSISSSLHSFTLHFLCFISFMFLSSAALPLPQQFSLAFPKYEFPFSFTFSAYRLFTRPSPSSCLRDKFHLSGFFGLRCLPATETLVVCLLYFIFSAFLITRIFITRISSEKWHFHKCLAMDSQHSVIQKYNKYNKPN
jgi:hypothetical protein